MMNRPSRPVGVVRRTSTWSDARAGRAVPQFALEPLDGVGIAFRRHFDAAVRDVPHPAVDAFAHGRCLGEVPEADALHAPANRVPSCDEHALDNRAANHTAPLTPTVVHGIF